MTTRCTNPPTAAPSAEASDVPSASPDTTTVSVDNSLGASTHRLSKLTLASFDEIKGLLAKLRENKSLALQITHLYLHGPFIVEASSAPPPLPDTGDDASCAQKRDSGYEDAERPAVVETRHFPATPPSTPPGASSSRLRRTSSDKSTCEAAADGAELELADRSNNHETQQRDTARAVTPGPATRARHLTTYLSRRPRKDYEVLGQTIVDILKLVRNLEWLALKDVPVLAQRHVRDLFARLPKSCTRLSLYQCAFLIDAPVRFHLCEALNIRHLDLRYDERKSEAPHHTAQALVDAFTALFKHNGNIIESVKFSLGEPPNSLNYIKETSLIQIVNMAPNLEHFTIEADLQSCALLLKTLVNRCSRTLKELKICLSSGLSPLLTNVHRTFVPAFDDKLAEAVACLPRLNSLAVASNDVTGKVLRNLPQAGFFACLCLANTQSNIKAPELAAFIQANASSLTKLMLRDVFTVNKSVVRKLSRCEKLKTLRFSSSKLTDAMVRVLLMGPAGTSLRELHLDACPKLTSNIVDILIQYGTRVEYLDVRRCPSLGRDDLIRLKCSLMRGPFQATAQEQHQVPCHQSHLKIIFM